MKRPLALDLFCGVGGMSLGFEQAGFDVIGAVDSEKIHVETYSKNFPSCSAQCIDLSAVSGDELRKKTGVEKKFIAALFAGPPCQGFSLMGRRLRRDPRNSLVYDLARLIVEISPSYFVVENVGGILIGDAKRVLETFVRRVEKAGYSVVQPIRILDAAEFGVPQRRRRVFLLGYQAALAAPQYPDPLYWFDMDGEIPSPTIWDAISDLPKISRYKYLGEVGEYMGQLGTPSAYAKVLRGQSREPDDFSLMRHTNGNGLSGCLRTEHTLETVKRFQNTKQGEQDEVSRFYRLTKNGLAPTLRAGTGPDKGSYMAPRPIHPFQNRCITVREAARLHSFPDWFHFHSTKWHAFRQIGNSVPPLLARAVATSISRVLNKSNLGG
jgi:DNA (cytosine-5)-methyltransferase 1